MAEEVDFVYLNLNQLLNEICQFLDTGISKENFTPEAKKEAKILIRRSKIQLEHISNLRNEYKSGGYMSMDKTLPVKEVSSKPIDKVLSPGKSVTSLAISEDFYCIYSELPARKLPMEEKNGHLSWRIKVLLGFEREQKIYAGICGNWLLIYRSEKESKPTHTYNLKNYMAKVSPVNNQTNHETHFSLVNIVTNLTIKFNALTNKDMEQWVVRINKCHQQGQRKQSEAKRILEMETVTHSEEEDEYDIIIVENHQQQTPRVNKEEEPDHTKEDIEEDVVYEDLSIIEPPPPQPVNSSVYRYPLNNPMQRMPLPSLPVEERSSSDSLASYHNPTMLRNSDKGSSHLEICRNSFSEEDSEEDIYDVPSAYQPPVPNILRTPIEERKPPIPLCKQNSFSSSKPAVQPKPSFLTKPKIDVKIISPPMYGKYSTKKIMKTVQENSMK